MKRSKFLLFSLTLVLACCVISFGQPSTANDDFYVVAGGGGWLGVYENDVNPNTSAWTVTGPSHGSVSIHQPLARMAYSALPNTYTGFDSFTYRFFSSASNIGTVSLLVIGNTDDQNAGFSCPVVGKPVNVTNGNMWIEHRDYTLPGLGENIEINRFYNSIIQTTGLFGFGWSTKYDESLVFYDDRMIRLNQPDGRAVYFGRTSTTTPFFSFSPGVVGELVPNMDGTYKLTYKDGSSRTFGSDGSLLSSSDRNGNETTLAYDINGLLSGITDGSGRTLTLVANGNGTISQISDSIGTIADYEYFPSTSLLKTVTYADGSRYKFEYTTVGTKTLLTTVKDALDNILEFHEYDSQGRAITSEKQGGVEKYTLVYTSQPDMGSIPPTPGITTVTDALGRVTKYHYLRKYGSNIISKTEGVCGGCGGGGSEVTTYEYDDRLNLVKKVDALSNQTLYTYDADRNVTQIVDPLGTQQWTYNAFGQVLTYKDRIDSFGSNNTSVNTYDPNGNQTTVTDALGKVTTIEYPATNNKGLPDSIKDARNNITKFKWIANSGLLDEIEDPYTKKTKFTYDARGRTKTVTNALNHVTQYNYFDDAQRKVEMIYPNLDKITYKYDIRRLLESVTDERGKITGYEYDSAYRLKKVTDPLGHFKELGYDLMSNVTTLKDPLGNITDYRYDDFNRLKEIEYPAASVGAARLKEKLEYDQLGRIKKVTDTANRDTTYVYDQVNRTVTVTNAELEATQTKYNQRLQTIEVKDALNQIYQFSYDPLGRVLSQTRAGGTTTFEYDDVGNQKKRIDYQGRETKYTHDKLNRLTEIEYLPSSEYPASQIPNLKSTFGYDDISRLTSAVNEAGTVSFGYDNRNRVTSTTDVFGQTLNYEYEHTPTVNQKRLKLNGAMYAAYNLDDADRLSNIVNSSDSTTISFGYDDEDKVTSRTYPNGVITSYEYDNMDRLKRLKDVSSSATLFDRQYAYNSANQIDHITEPTNSRFFTYDNVNRLAGMVNATSLLTNENYSYDDVGNRTTSHKSNSYGYQPFNKLTSTQTATYNYDASGNTVSKSEGSNFWRYTWDYENRMGSASTRKQTVRYKYDALGRRVQRATGGGKENTKFTYDGQDVLIDDDSGTITKYLNGTGIDNKLRQSSGSSVNYFLADHLGSTNGLADNAGSLTSSTSYDSFGTSTNANIPTRYQFTGRENDTFTGLMHYRARQYDPKLGRFISEDPIGFGGGDINLYGYVWNNPHHFTDPFGLDGWGNDTADWLDGNIEFARQFWQPKEEGNPDWWTNGVNNSVADVAHGFADLFRVGSGTGRALYCEDNGYGRAAFIAMDVTRGAGLFALIAGPATKIPTTAPNKGLGTNPFKGKTPQQIDDMFRNKGYQPRGPDPMNGKGNYVNPRNGRGYHIDANHPPPKPPHVGAHRSRGNRNTMGPREYPLQ